MSSSSRVGARDHRPRAETTRARKPRGGTPDWRPFRLDTRARASYAGLGPHAKLYWMCARLAMHSAGIDICYPGGVAGAASLSLEEASAAEAELVAAGEARRDGAILWIIYGLREHEAGSFRAGNENHRINVEEQLTKLGASPLAAEFRDFYPAWFGPIDKAAGPKEQLDLLPKLQVVPDGASHRDPIAIPSRSQNTDNRLTPLPPLEPPASLPDSASEETPSQGVSHSPGSVATPTADATATSHEDGSVVFDELLRVARSPGFHAHNAREFRLSLPPPAAAALQIVPGGALTLMGASEVDLAGFRKKFAAAYRRARAPAGQSGSEPP